MRYFLSLFALVVLTGCVATTGDPGAAYAPDYNDFRYLTGHVPAIRGARDASPAGPTGQDTRARKYPELMQKQDGSDCENHSSQ